MYFLFFFLSITNSLSKYVLHDVNTDFLPLWSVNFLYNALGDMRVSKRDMTRTFDMSTYYF